MVDSRQLRLVRIANQHIITITAVKRIVATEPEQDVVAGATVEQVGPVQATVNVGPVANQRVRAILAIEDIVATIASELVVSGTAEKAVVAIARIR